MTRRIPLPALLLATLVAFAIGCAHGVDPTDPDAIDGTGGGSGNSGSFSGTGSMPGGTGATVSSSGGTGSSSSSGGTPSTGAAPSSGGGNSPGAGGGSSGGPSAGGTSVGGAAGAAGSGAGGVVVDPVLPGDVVVQYFSAENGTGITNIKPHFNIVNRGKKLVPLAQLTLRYWYTADGTITASNYQELQLDYAEVSRLTNGGTKVTMSVAAAMPPQPNADTYIEVGFTGTDSIGPGKVDVDKNPFLATKQIEVAAHWPGYQTKYDQSNDYSYGAKTAFVDWPKVTLYQNGVLIWGTEPDGTMPSGAGEGDAGAPPSPSDAGRD